MKNKLIFFLIAALCTTVKAEDVTLTVAGPISTHLLSNTITLHQGDTAKLQFLYADLFAAGYASVLCSVNSTQFTIPIANNNTQQNPVTVSGPATIQIQRGSATNSTSTSGSIMATFQITRAGTASPPAAIPQEAGTTWNVILESSSDLINWIPANPGQYSGTEPKRFFRTRMVKIAEP